MNGEDTRLAALDALPAGAILEAILRERIGHLSLPILLTRQVG